LLSLGNHIDHSKILLMVFQSCSGVSLMDYYVMFSLNTELRASWSNI